MENGVSHYVGRVTQGRVSRTRGWMTLPHFSGGARDSDRWHVLVRLRETKRDAPGLLLLLFCASESCRAPCLCVCTPFQAAAIFRRRNTTFNECWWASWIPS